MTAEDDIREFREFIKEFREALRDVSYENRRQGERLDGFSTRLDDLVEKVGEVQLQSALTAGTLVEIADKLAKLDTATWDETARTIRRAKGVAGFVRRRGLAIVVAVGGGAGGIKLLEALFN